MTLESIPGFRVDRHKKYSLGEILFLTFSAVVSGFSDWDKIADFGKEKLPWLRGFYAYKNGTSSHDTINRVVSMLDPRIFEGRFIGWTTKGLSACLEVIFP